MTTAGNINVTVTADTRRLRVALLRVHIQVLQLELARLEAELAREEE